MNLPTGAMGGMYYRGMGEPDPQFSEENWRDYEQRSLIQMIEGIRKTRQVLNEEIDRLDKNKGDRNE